MAAADHIERNPLCYAFNNGGIPGTRHNDAGMPCCMLARIGEFLNEDRKQKIIDFREVAYALGTDEVTFYNRIVSLSRVKCCEHCALYDAGSVPAALRLYAERYHGIPGAVRELFDVTYPPYLNYGPAMNRFVHTLESQGETHAFV
jgi:hypothetical protein